MQYEEFYSRVVAKLDEVLELRASDRGRKRALRKALGVGESFFGDLRRQKGRIPMDKILKLLNHLKVDTRQFLRSVVDDEPSACLLPRDSEDFGTSELIAVAQESFAESNPHECSSKGYWKYKVLERMRSEQPRRTITLVKVAIPHVHRLFVPYLLGVYGSALRALNHYEQALESFAAGREMARKLGDLSVLGNLRRRELHVWFEQGDLNKALRLAVEAGNLFELDGNYGGKGRSLVDQAGMFHHLGHFTFSIRAGKAALRLLPAGEIDHRFAAMLGNAFNLEQMGRTTEAKNWAEMAHEASQGVGQSMMASLLWLRGRLAKHDGDHHLAARCHSEAFSYFFDREMYLDAAGAAIELCEAHLLSRRPDLAEETARSSMVLIGRLRRNRTAAATIAELSRLAASGRMLTLKILDQARLSLEESKANPLESSTPR